MEMAVPAVDRAIEAVTRPQAGGGSELDPDESPGRSALSYLETILEGRPREAIKQLVGAVDGGTSVKDVYLTVLIPAQREAGRMWHVGELSVAEEHVVTETTRRAMAILAERAQSSPSKDKSALLACVAGNAHDVGIRAISDLFEMAGWRAINLGSDVPHDEIARSVQLFDADVVVLAATLDPHLKGVQRAIERIRTLQDQDVKIIVGGQAFDTIPDLWRKVGADGYSPRIEDTEPLGSQLTRE
jgi:methanogenic corrinoid protein MtbC1